MRKPKYNKDEPMDELLPEEEIPLPEEEMPMEEEMMPMADEEMMMEEPPMDEELPPDEDMGDELGLDEAPPEELMDESSMEDSALLDEYRGMAEPAESDEDLEQQSLEEAGARLAQAESVIDPDDQEMVTRMRKLLQLRSMAREDAAKKFQEDAFNTNIVAKTENKGM